MNKFVEHYLASVNLGKGLQKSIRKMTKDCTVIVSLPGKLRVMCPNGVKKTFTTSSMEFES